MNTQRKAASVFDRKFRKRSGTINLEKFKHGSYWSDRIFRLLVYVLLFDLVFVFLFPFMYMFITSLKTDADLMDITVKWIPKTLKFSNYKMALRYLDAATGLKNSVFVTGLAVLGHILSCSFIAYGFARYKFPGRSMLFALVIVSFIVPAQTIIVPQYIRYASLRWTNSYKPLIIPTFMGFGLKGGLFIFIFRQFFLGVPKELEEAAIIDGCGSFKTYFAIILPIARSSILVSAVLAMVWHWNDYFEPTIYITKTQKYLLPQMLPSMYEMMKMEKQTLPFDPLTMTTVERTLNEAVVMAGTVIVILPLLITYLFLQRHFLQGIERTGLVE
jgi:multiple sugar transport system permease protein